MLNETVQGAIEKSKRDENSPEGKKYD